MDAIIGGNLNHDFAQAANTNEKWPEMLALGSYPRHIPPSLDGNADE
jgi:hypothetical protein